MTQPIIILCALGVIALLGFVCVFAPLHDQRGDDARDYGADESWADRFHASGDN